MSKLQYQNYIHNYVIKSKAKAGKKQRAKVKDWTRGNRRTKKGKSKKTDWRKWTTLADEKTNYSMLD